MIHDTVAGFTYWVLSDTCSTFKHGFHIRSHVIQYSCLLVRLRVANDDSVNSDYSNIILPLEFVYPGRVRNPLVVFREVVWVAFWVVVTWLNEGLL